MDTGYCLHFAPDNASFIIRMALEELGLPYRTALVDRAAKAQEKPAYRKLNPLGLIPTLETPDGPIFETGAILLWLADRHPGPLVPAPDSPQRGDALKWLFFLSNTLHPALRMLFYPEKHIGPDTGQQAQLRRHMQTEITRLLDILEHQGPPADPQAPAAADLYLACLLRWMKQYADDGHGWFVLSRWPRLHGMCKGLEARDAIQRAQAAEGLGARPFTDPQDPAPPEGTAT